MDTYKRIERIVEELAIWALDYRSAGCHDSDVLTYMGSHPVTVGSLRWAFERHFGMPFTAYQSSPKLWLEGQGKVA